MLTGIGNAVHCILCVPFEGSIRRHPHGSTLVPGRTSDTSLLSDGVRRNLMVPIP